METPDGSQNAHRQALAKLMKLVVALLGSLTPKLFMQFNVLSPDNVPIHSFRALSCASAGKESVL